VKLPERIDDRPIASAPRRYVMAIESGTARRTNSFTQLNEIERSFYWMATEALERLRTYVRQSHKLP